MAKNLMQEILKMLGVEYGEKFKLRAVDSEICEAGLFYFDKENGFLRCIDEESPKEVYDLVYDVVSGYYEVAKLPWEPKNGDHYFFASIPNRLVYETAWHGETCDFALKTLGLIYRTREEAEANFASDYGKLMGKPLSSC